MSATTTPGARVATALLALGVLCGGAAASADPALDRRHRIEKIKAGCMEEKGFRYVPYVKPEPRQSEEEHLRAAGDYEAMRVHRAFFGFGVFSVYVHGRAPVEPSADPNDKITQDRPEGYRAALDACVARAVERVVGLDVKSEFDHMRQVGELSHQAVSGALDSDPRLVRLAAAMAACLEEKGYEVTDATPVALSTRGRDAFADLDTRLDGTEPPATEEGELFITIDWKVLTYEEAKPYLDQEIKAALDDLECGREFYPAYLPRENAIERRIHDRYGTTPFPWASEEA